MLPPQDHRSREWARGFTKRARDLNKVLDKFWVRWRKEYLLELRETHRHHRGHASPSSIAVNDIVIVHSADQLCGFWKFGWLKELLTGQDGKIRGAILQVAGKGWQATSLYCPLQLLYPLEASLWSENSSHDAAVGAPASPNITNGSPPPVEQEQVSVDVLSNPDVPECSRAFKACCCLRGSWSTPGTGAQWQYGQFTTFVVNGGRMSGTVCSVTGSPQ